MENLNRFLDTFINEDTIIIFLVLLVILLLILVIALLKVKKNDREIDFKLDNLSNFEETKEDKKVKENDTFNDLTLDSLKATCEEDKFDENKPLIKQVDIPEFKTYSDIIEIYENSEEENAVISNEELDKKKKERMDELGTTDNQAIIDKYEEEQEKKAIISYEQLVKNASNITLNYTHEEPKKAGAPIINKIEIQHKEVTPCENYLKEEEFLKILKEFRLKLE